MGALEPIEVQRARCEECRDVLRNLARIHTEIDAPTRRVGADEPDWVFRLRKVCLHAVAITKCEVSVDGVHVMTTELRAAYEQMDAVWKCLPNEFRFNEDGSWWANEATDRLAAYNHPTMFSLALSLPDLWRGDAGPGGLAVGSASQGRSTPLWPWAASSGVVVTGLAAVRPSVLRAPDRHRQLTWREIRYVSCIGQGQPYR